MCTVQNCPFTDSPFQNCLFPDLFCPSRPFLILPFQNCPFPDLPIFQNCPHISELLFFEFVLSRFGSFQNCRFFNSHFPELSCFIVLPIRITIFILNHFFNRFYRCYYRISINIKKFSIKKFRIPKRQNTMRY